MKNGSETSQRDYPSPLFSKTAREWILSSALYDGIEDEDIRQIRTLLIERGANPNVLLPEYGITPFHLVVANENLQFAVQAADICLQHGADPNVRSEDGLTPVHLAAMWGCSEVLHVLLASGGNPWLVDSFNKNAFDYALSEGQQECYNIIQTYCNFQPKLSSHSKSPYQLNLKRVILYKNDLQIVYDASPTNSKKCVSTQTSPLIPTSEQVKGLTNNSTEKQNVHHKMCYAEENDSVGNKAHECHMKNIYEKRRKHENNHNSYKNNENTRLSRKLKEVIVKHRRNSSIFEYSPPNHGIHYLNSEVISRKDADNEVNDSEVTGSDLIKRLEYTNKIRQSLKKSDSQHVDVFKNITQRKKPSLPVLVSSASNGIVNQDSFPKNEIGFVLNNSKDSSNTHSLKHQVASQNVEFVLNDSKSGLNKHAIVNNSDTIPSFETSSIGFILDKLDNTSETRGSSLFSDITSDNEAYLPIDHDYNTNDLITEDEINDLITEDEINFTKHSSSDSLYPYVSCNNESTRELESNETFESCSERLGNIIFTPLTSKGEPEISEKQEEYSMTNDINSIVDSILDNIGVEKTPVNPKLVTSTPERKHGSSEVEKQGWVEAKVLSSDEEYISISEEYEYTDLDEGIVLIEKRYLLDDASSENVKKQQHPNTVLSSATSEESEVSTISRSDGAYDTDELRRALQKHGFAPGPITGNTKHVYLRKLKRCQKKPQPLPQIGQSAYSAELVKTLQTSCEHLLFDWAHLEDSMSASFICGRRPWREGSAKTSFTYLLLDPRVAHNLPAFVSSVPHHKLWADFLHAIFYVGKGKRSRPYAHLYHAVTAWKQQDTINSKKIQRILDIWKSGLGVICLHVFLNVIPVEAYTREAAMISALTLTHLTNEKAGEFYGSAACWSLRLKRRLGCVLLHRACKVFLAEGERQLRPPDIE